MSRRRVNFEIALTHLMAKKKMTLIAMLGVTFGISMFITMISFMTGVNDFLMELTLDGSPHIRIHNPIENKRTPLAATADGADIVYLHHSKPKRELPRIKDGLLIEQEIAGHPAVLMTTPQVSTQVFYNNGPVKISGSVTGADILKEDAMYDISSKMRSGDIRNLLTYRDGLIMGSGLAEKLGVGEGDRVSLTTPEGVSLMFRVVGTFTFGIGAIDDVRSYATVGTVQKILQKDPSYITDIHIKMKDYRAASAVALDLHDRYGYEAEDWETANAQIIAGEIVRNTLTYVVSVTMLIVAGFGIYNIMNMNIISKMKDIAILKATGFDGRDITSIFLLQSLIIGAAGGLIGLFIGLVLSTIISYIPFPETGGIITIDTFPVSFHLRHYLMGIVFGLLTTLFAGWFPSRKASRIDPVEIIRG